MQLSPEGRILKEPDLLFTFNGSHYCLYEKLHEESSHLERVSDGEIAARRFELVARREGFEPSTLRSEV